MANKNRTKDIGLNESPAGVGKNTTPSVSRSDHVDDESKLLGQVMHDFNVARKYVRDNYQDVWDKCFSVYNSRRVQRDYDGVSDDFVPEVFSIVESIKSAICRNRIVFKYLPQRVDQEDDCDVLNALTSFYLQQNQMQTKAIGLVNDMIVYGNGVGMVSWGDGIPVIQHIPLSDVFVDPTATHLNRPEEPGYPRYMGYRFLTTIDQLKSETIPDSSGKIVQKYKNLDMVGAGKIDSDMTDKQRKEMFIGSTLGSDASGDQIEVIVYFTRRKKVCVANRGVIILNEDNPYHKDAEDLDVPVEIDGQTETGSMHIPEIRGFLPFFIFRNYIDNNLFFARGDVENIIELQEAMNDVSSQKRDNLAYALNGMFQLDPRFKAYKDQVESSPGRVLVLPKGALTVLDRPDISASADTEIARLQQAMRSVTAADAAVQGSAQQFARTTATEIAAQKDAAGARFTTKVQTLENEGLGQLARILYKMIQIFVDQPTAVRLIGRDGVSWKMYEPGDYNGEYEPKAALQATVEAEEMQQTQAIQAFMQFSINNPLINQQQLLRLAAERMLTNLPQDDVDKLFEVPQPIMGPDGQAVDPALTQGDAAVTPDAAAMLRGESSEGEQPRRKYNSFGNTTRGRATQSGMQGGGGADSSNNNIRRLREDQPSTRLRASATPRSTN